MVPRLRHNAGMDKVNAIRIHATGGPEQLVLDAVDVGEPGPGEIRIRQHASGLNFIDVYHRTGLYPLPLPHALGMEGAGIVESVGEGVDHLRVGDRAAYAGGPPGSYSEARTMPAKNVVRLPDGIAFDTAAGMMLKGLTAQYLLRRTLPVEGLERGDFVLFHAAAGGVGLIACQWAKALGLQLIGTAGGPAKCALALAHGAAHAIDYKSEDFVARVKEITGGRGVKVVYDSIGKDTFEKSLESLRPRGMLVLFGNASGAVPPVDPLVLNTRGSLFLTRPSLGHYIANREELAWRAGEVFDLVGRGALTVRIDGTFPLAAAADAHRRLEAIPLPEPPPDLPKPAAAASGSADAPDAPCVVLTVRGKGYMLGPEAT